MDHVDRLETGLATDLCAVTRAFEEAAISYAVIGANALILQEITLPRTTRDLDLVVIAEEGLDRLRSILEGHGLRSTSIAHRFVTSRGSEVDILPLSPEDGPDIEFPDGERITAVGLPEAVRNAQGIETGPCALRVAPLPILAAIKLHAATVRVGDRDLTDALAIMEQFESTGNRRFELDYQAAPALVWETAGAFLLGQDAGSMLDESTRHRVADAIEILLNDPRLGANHSQGEGRAPLLHAFRAGLVPDASTEDAAAPS